MIYSGMMDFIMNKSCTVYNKIPNFGYPYKGYFYKSLF